MAENYKSPFLNGMIGLYSTGSKRNARVCGPLYVGRNDKLSLSGNEHIFSQLEVGSTG